MDNDFRICEHCLVENELQQEIRERGVKVDKCIICKSIGGHSLSTGDHRVKQIFRALVRLNYSEWDYNSHVGGDSLQSILFGRNKIFDLSDRSSEIDFEDAFMSLEDGWYPEDPNEISLGGGYWDGCILNGLRDRTDQLVDNILSCAFTRNYFELEVQVKDLIESIRTDITSELTVGREFARARIGVKDRLKSINFDGANNVKFHYLPYSANDIDQPPISKATEGRLNRERVSILYLASDVETAVAELRPHPGHLVSTAKFQLKRSLKIADFSTHDIRNFLSDDRLEILRRILSFSAVLNLPVQPERKELYVLTQLFSDCIRIAGFEAISFRSTLGTGTNYAIFATDVFKQISDSESVLEVRSLKYSLETRSFLYKNYSKDEFEPDRSDALATLSDGLARNT